MTSKQLEQILDNILFPKGFKRAKSSNWELNTNELRKIVNLQKSNFGNIYYINYGFIIINLPLTTYMHIENRLVTKDPEENKKIYDALNLEKNLPDEIRVKTISDNLQKVINKFEIINTEEDLLKELKSRDNLNDIFLVVKKYFKLI